MVAKAAVSPRRTLRSVSPGPRATPASKAKKVAKTTGFLSRHGNIYVYVPNLIGAPPSRAASIGLRPPPTTRVPARLAARCCASPLVACCNALRLQLPPPPRLSFVQATRESLPSSQPSAWLSRRRWRRCSSTYSPLCATSWCARARARAARRGPARAELRLTLRAGWPLCTKVQPVQHVRRGAGHGDRQAEYDGAVCRARGAVRPPR